MMRNTGRRRGSQQERLSVDLGLAAALLIAVFLFGGSQRMDVASQMLVRLAALAAIALACVRMTPDRWAIARRPTLFMLAAAAVPALQLVPLPPAIWAALPGHDLYAGAQRTVRLADAWRPISLSPDRTLNSLLACLPPIAGTLVFALVPREQRGTLIGILLILAGIGAVLSTIQAATGTGYFYATLQVSPSSNFANRNHWSLYLACCFPFLVAWVCAAEAQVRKGRWMIASAGAIAVLPMLLIAGSRAGFVLGAAALAASGVAAWPLLQQASFLRSPRRRAALVTVVVVAMSACATIVLLGRGAALSRLLHSGDQVDLRSANLPAVWQMLQSFFPEGVGFGVFDPVFRVFEADALLRPSYYNHAHNDAVELVIEAGALGVALVLAVVCAIGRTSITLWRKLDRSAALTQARVMVIPLGVLLAGSLTDYPLRTPFLATVFILCAIWIDQDAQLLRTEGGLGTRTKVR